MSGTGTDHQPQDFQCCVEEEGKPCPQVAVCFERTRGDDSLWPLCERHASIHRAARGLSMGKPQPAPPQKHAVVGEQKMPAQRGAFRDRAHIKQFLQASGRQWILLKSSDLIDAIPFPEGVEVVQQLIAAYGQHRAMRSSGWKEPTPADVRKGFAKNGMPAPRDIPIMLDEMPSVDELVEAIKFLMEMKKDAEARLARKFAERE